MVLVTFAMDAVVKRLKNALNSAVAQLKHWQTELDSCMNAGIFPKTASSIHWVQQAQHKTMDNPELSCQCILAMMCSFMFKSEDFDFFNDVFTADHAVTLIAYASSRVGKYDQPLGSLYDFASRTTLPINTQSVNGVTPFLGRLLAKGTDLQLVEQNAAFYHRLIAGSSHRPLHNRLFTNMTTLRQAINKYTMQNVLNIDETEQKQQQQLQQIHADEKDADYPLLMTIRHIFNADNSTDAMLLLVAREARQAIARRQGCPDVMLDAKASKYADAIPWDQLIGRQPRCHFVVANELDKLIDFCPVNVIFTTSFHITSIECLKPTLFITCNQPTPEWQDQLIHKNVNMRANGIGINGHHALLTTKTVGDDNQLLLLMRLPQLAMYDPQIEPAVRLLIEKDISEATATDRLQQLLARLSEAYINSCHKWHLLEDMAIVDPFTRLYLDSTVN
jgi:hypothetical protein